MQTSGDVSAGVLADEPIAVRLKRRADFRHVGKGRRWHGKALTLQAAPRESKGAGTLHSGARIGFTLTKKVGCAVVRNRARRRLRETVRLARGLTFQADCDYVIVGRLDAIRLPFDMLRQELASALRAVHHAGRGSAGKRLASDQPAGDGRTRHGGRNAGTERAKGAAPAGTGPERTRPKP